MKRASQLHPDGPGDPLSGRLAWIPGGEFLMGSEELYPEERPVHRVAVDGFWMDEHPVTAAARQPQMTDTSMSHLGSRCIIRPRPGGETQPQVDASR